MKRDVERASWKRSSIDQSSTEVVKNNHILPHTRDFGDVYYSGTIYDRYTRKEQHGGPDERTMYDEYSLPPWLQGTSLSQGPYLTYLKRLRYAWPSVGYLAEWMDVTTSPLKQKFLSSRDQLERAVRTRVSVVEYDSAENCNVHPFDNADALRDFLDPSKGPPDTRLIIVEDLSREVIEVLGARFELDPLFFTGQISDYKWFNLRDPWFEAPPLSVVSRKRQFSLIEFMQARYFRTAECLSKANLELGGFNILRRNEVDNATSRGFDEEGSDGGLLRSKTSLWAKSLSQGDDPAVVAILLVDPQLRSGFPLWGGYLNFSSVPPMSKVLSEVNPPSASMFEDMVKRLSALDSNALKRIRQDPQYVLRFPLMRVASEWQLAIQYAGLRLAQVTWELEKPDFLSHVDDGSEGTLRKLNPWRRRLPFMRKCVCRVIDQITDRKSSTSTTNTASGTTTTTSTHTNSLYDLNQDFLEVQKQIDDLIAQTDKILSVAIAMVSIEESRKAIEQNSNVARLTYIALIFVPMSFIASLFSMTSDLASMKDTFWVFFVVAIPISAIIVALVAKSKTLIDKIFGVEGKRKGGWWHKGRAGYEATHKEK